MAKENNHVFLVKKPGVNGVPSTDNFGFGECTYPGDLTDGEVIIQNIFLSVDPAQRCQMNDDTGVDYCKPWVIGETIEGFVGVGKVIQSSHPEFSNGDLVLGGKRWPWKAFFKENMNDRGNGITKIGRILGCTNVVGICGSDEKCTWLKKELGFNATINYKTEDVEKRLKETCPAGIDAYFDNTGGDISDKVILQMNQHSHVILCGQISQYNKDVPYPPPIPAATTAAIKDKQITRERYLVLNYMDKFPEGVGKLAMWYAQGLIQVGETVEDGLCNAGRAFVSMMTGGNKGKQLVKVS